MKKNVLILGSQGYLGSRLSEYLKQRGYNCSGMDTGFFKDGVLTSIDSINTISKDARLVVESDLEGSDSVILLAGISNDPFGNMSSEQIYDPTRDYALRIASMCVIFFYITCNGVNSVSIYIWSYNIDMLSVVRSISKLL